MHSIYIFMDKKDIYNVAKDLHKNSTILTFWCSLAINNVYLKEMKHIKL